MIFGGSGAARCGSRYAMGCRTLSYTELMKKFRKKNLKKVFSLTPLLAARGPRAASCPLMV